MEQQGGKAIHRKVIETLLSPHLTGNAPVHEMLTCGITFLTASYSHSIILLRLWEVTDKKPPQTFTISNDLRKILRDGFTHIYSLRTGE